MNFKSRIGIVAAIAMMMAMGMSAERFAAAADVPVPSGNLNLRLDGYEVVTPESSTPARLSIDEIGQIIADTKGNLSGAETVNAVDATACRPKRSVTNGQRIDHAAYGRVWLGRRRIRDQPQLHPDQHRRLLHLGDHHDAVQPFVTAQTAGR
jgi:hypothetical protein